MRSHPIMQFVDRAIERICKPQPQYSVTAQFARSNYLDDIHKSEREAEKMRVREIEKRSKLAEALGRLAYETEMAKFKLEVRILDQGMACLDVHFDAMKDAENALIEEVENIHLAELEIADAYRVLDDPECWSDEATAQLDARKAASRG